MNWPATLAPPMAPTFLVTLAVIVCVTVLLAAGRIYPALWWAVVAGVLAFVTVAGIVTFH